MFRSFDNLFCTLSKGTSVTSQLHLVYKMFYSYPYFLLLNSKFSLSEMSFTHNNYSYTSCSHIKSITIKLHRLEFLAEIRFSQRDKFLC